jgi:glutamate racemase
VYEFTLQAVTRLFDEGCRLVVLACNTASAKALRTIQQIDLPKIDSQRRVLGVIRPTVEAIGNISQSRHIGVVGTPGTIDSESYPIEIRKIYPDIVVNGEACPMWVPLVENREYDKPGADYFIRQHIDNLLSKDDQIDTLVLGCTHYPLLREKIRKFLPGQIRLLPQGEYVAASLRDYLRRHPEMDEKCSKNATTRFYTTESEDKFKEMAAIFLKEEVEAKRVLLESMSTNASTCRR